MKRLIKIFAVFFIAVGFATGSYAKCSGDDLVTDLEGKKWGCRCTGSNSLDEGSLIVANDSLIVKCVSSGIFSSDKWEEVTPSCPGYEEDQMDKTKHTRYVDKVAKCWKFKCTTGYFMAKDDGTLDKNSCVPCTGISETKQGDTCFNIKCGSGNPAEDISTRNKPFGSEVVIWNNKCIPVCDVKTAGAWYESGDTADKTKLTIRFQSANAGTVGVR